MSQHTPPGGGPPRASPAVFLGCKVGDSSRAAESKESGGSLLSGATPTGSFSGHAVPQNPAVTPTQHRDLPSGGLPINIRDPARAAGPAIVRQEGEVDDDGFIEDIDFGADDATSHAGSGGFQPRRGGSDPSGATPRGATINPARGGPLEEPPPPSHRRRRGSGSGDGGRRRDPGPG